MCSKSRKRHQCFCGSNEQDLHQFFWTLFPSHVVLAGMWFVQAMLLQLGIEWTTFLHMHTSHLAGSHAESLTSSDGDNQTSELEILRFK